MTIIELRDKLNKLIDEGYGDVSIIGQRVKNYDGVVPYIRYNPLTDIEIREDRGSIGLNLVIEKYRSHLGPW